MYALNVAEDTHWKLFLVYLKFKLNWASCILSGISTWRLKRGIKKTTKAPIYASQRRVLLNAPGLRSSPQNPFILTVTYMLEGTFPRVESSMVWTKSCEALGSRSAPPKVCTCSDSLR